MGTSLFQNPFTDPSNEILYNFGVQNGIVSTPTPGFQLPDTGLSSANRYSSGTAGSSGSIPDPVLDSIHKNYPGSAELDEMMDAQREREKYSDLFDLLDKYNTAQTNAATTAYKRQKKLLQMQQEYNTKMSNTAVQRYKADLQAAGFNPLMAVLGNSQLGASTPTSSAPAVQKADFESGVSTIGSLVIQSMRDAQSVLDREQQAIQFDKSLSETQRQAREREALQTWQYVTGTIIDVAKMFTGGLSNNARSIGYTDSWYDEGGAFTKGFTRRYDY